MMQASTTTIGKAAAAAVAGATCLEGGYARMVSREAAQKMNSIKEVANETHHPGAMIDGTTGVMTGRPVHGTIHVKSPTLLEGASPTLQEGPSRTRQAGSLRHRGQIRI